MTVEDDQRCAMSVFSAPAKTMPAGMASWLLAAGLNKAHNDGCLASWSDLQFSVFARLFGH